MFKHGSIKGIILVVLFASANTTQSSQLIQRKLLNKGTSIELTAPTSSCSSSSSSPTISPNDITLQSSLLSSSESSDAQGLLTEKKIRLETRMEKSTSSQPIQLVLSIEKQNELIRLCDRQKNELLITKKIKELYPLVPVETIASLKELFYIEALNEVVPVLNINQKELCNTYARIYPDLTNDDISTLVSQLLLHACFAKIDAAGKKHLNLKWVNPSYCSLHNIYGNEAYCASDCEYKALYKWIVNWRNARLTLLPKPEILSKVAEFKIIFESRKKLNDGDKCSVQPIPLVLTIKKQNELIRLGDRRKNELLIKKKIKELYPLVPDQGIDSTMNTLYSENRTTTNLSIGEKELFYIEALNGVVPVLNINQKELCNTYARIYPDLKNDDISILVSQLLLHACFVQIHAAAKKHLKEWDTLYFGVHDSYKNNEYHSRESEYKSMYEWIVCQREAWLRLSPQPEILSKVAEIKVDFPSEKAGSDKKLNTEG